MLLTGQPSIREIIAFPKNQAAMCMVSGAPSVADPAGLAELGIAVIAEESEEGEGEAED